MHSIHYCKSNLTLYVSKDCTLAKKCLKKEVTSTTCSLYLANTLTLGRFCTLICKRHGKITQQRFQNKISFIYVINAGTSGRAI